MNQKTLHIPPGKGRLAFTVRADNQRPWWRDLDLDGQPLYRIGNNCDTCPALFERLSHAALPLAPAELAARLRAGLDGLPPEVIDTVSAILPGGRYAVALLTIHPAHYPSAHRLRAGPGQHALRQQTMLSPTVALPEIFIPLAGEEQYNTATLEYYEEAIARLSFPTALALSVLDVRYPSGKTYEWQLAHFLLDGHHKVMAASRVGRPITLLSFLALDESFAPQPEIDQVVKLRYR